jgi:hypothetical protein
MSGKVVIDQKALAAIKGHAHRAWLERRSWNGLDEREVQQIVIISGLASYLTSQGAEVPFELPPELHETYDPIEEEWTPVKDPKK